MMMMMMMMIIIIIIIIITIMKCEIKETCTIMYQYHVVNRVHMASLTSFNFSANSLATASSESSDVTLSGSNSFPMLGSLWLLFLRRCS